MAKSRLLWERWTLLTHRRPSISIESSWPYAKQTIQCSSWMRPVKRRFNWFPLSRPHWYVAPIRNFVAARWATKILPRQVSFIYAVVPQPQPLKSQSRLFRTNWLRLFPWPCQLTRKLWIMSRRHLKTSKSEDRQLNSQHLRSWVTCSPRQSPKQKPWKTKKQHL